LSETKERITKAARHLFYSQGYSNTTIKQICAAAGVPVGSVYHFFENKYAILSEVTYGAYDLHTAAVDSFFKDREISNEYRYCAICMCMFYAMEQNVTACALTIECYRDGKYLNELSAHVSEANYRMFGHYAPEISSEEYFQRTLFVEGGIYAFMAQRCLGNRNSFIERLRTFFSIALSAYFVPDVLIKETVSDANLRKLIEDARQIDNILGYRQYGI